jgi:hypothetical protein
VFPEETEGEVKALTIQQPYASLIADRFTYGLIRVFVPICVRHPMGFIGGPDGYEERTAEHVDDAPIVVVAEKD